MTPTDSGGYYPEDIFDFYEDIVLRKLPERFYNNRNNSDKMK